jgi:hypothetical protein
VFCVTKAIPTTRVDGNRPTVTGGLHKCIGPLGKAGSTSDENPVRGHNEKRKGLREEVGPVGRGKVLLAEKAVTRQKFGHILGGGGWSRRRVIW